MPFRRLVSRHKTLFFPETSGARKAPAVGWAVLIFILSSIPGDKYPEVDVPFADKWVHALFYLVLGMLLARSIHPGASTKVRYLVPVIIGTAYGAFDELHQLFIPRRSCSLDDFIVDMVSVAVGTAVWYAVLRFASLHAGR